MRPPSVYANPACPAGCPCDVARPRHGPHRVAARLVMILLSHGGWPTSAIADLLGCDASTEAPLDPPLQVCDGGGLPLTAVVTAANVNDTTVFQAVVDDVPPVRTPAGRRRTRPAKVHADKGYDSRANRAWLWRRGIKARIARRQIESSTRLGRHRWKVERSLSWLSCWRRLQVRWDRDAGRWFAFVLVEPHPAGRRQSAMDS